MRHFWLFYSLSKGKFTCAVRVTFICSEERNCTYLFPLCWPGFMIMRQVNVNLMPSWPDELLAKARCALTAFSPTALPMRKTARWSPEMAVDQWHVRVGSRAAAHCLAGTSLRVSTVCFLCGKSWVEDLFLIFLHVLCNCLCAATFVEWWTAVSKANCFWTVKIKPVLQRWWILRKHCGPWECMIWTSK